MNGGVRLFSWLVDELSVASWLVNGSSQRTRLCDIPLLKLDI